jgi:hypothetical protein
MALVSLAAYGPARLPETFAWARPLGMRLFGGMRGLRAVFWLAHGVRTRVSCGAPLSLRVRACVCVRNVLTRRRRECMWVQAHVFEACLALRLALKHERHNALGWTAQARVCALWVGVRATRRRTLR